MSRVQPKSIPTEDRLKLLNEFWTMIALLNSHTEVKNFFKDLLSETEAIMLGRRIQIAKLLLQGRSYEFIRRSLKSSYATIAGVHRWLQSGFGGYEKLLPRLEKEMKRRETIRHKEDKAHSPFTFEWLKRRYPLHFLLLHAIDWARFRPPKKLRRK